MTKADIVNEVSRKTGISRDEVLRTLKSFSAEIGRASCRERV